MPLYNACPMKIAVLADVHGNLPALQTVSADIDAWRPDAVILGGDLVNRGPRPAACLRFALAQQRQAGWRFVRGNHEDYVLDQARPDAARSGPEFELARNGYWTYQRLDGQTADLEAMPFQISVDGPDRKEVRVVHASMRGNRDGIFPHTPDAELRRQIAPAPAVFCVGHTHRPLIRTVDQVLVINAGSVGMPFDGDKRAAYAQLTWQNGLWHAEIVRLGYDHDQMERDFFETGFIEGAGDLARIMLVEFRQARSHIHIWAARYESAVLAGQITVADSVNRYLESLGLNDP